MRRKNSTGLPVLVGALAEMDLPQVGRELGLLISAAGDVRVRSVTTSRQGLSFPSTAASISEPPALRFSLRTCSSKRRRRSSFFIFSISSACGAEIASQQSVSGVQRAIGVVAGKCLLMCPFVAMVTQLANKGCVRSNLSRSPQHALRITSQLTNW